MRKRGMELGSGGLEHAVPGWARVAVIPHKAEEVGGGGGMIIRGFIT